MRNAFIKALCEVAQKDDRVFLITGDLGYKILEPFKEKFPKRFLNIGVAESNMVTVAAGLATVGFIPFIYSIANFSTMRPFEQIRNDICLQNLNVKIVGIGGGLTYGKSGPTHHSFEDIALMRLLPNMTIIIPSDPNETYAATKVIYKHKGPLYLRLEKNPKTNIYDTPPLFEIGKARIIRRGKRIVLFAVGVKVETAKVVARILEERGFDPAVYSLTTVWPLNEKFLSKISKTFDYIITIEEHKITGGFGSAILEYNAKIFNHSRVINFGLKDKLFPVSADHEELMYLHGLTPKQIATSIVKRIKKSS